jgi:MFS family permease
MILGLLLLHLISIIVAWRGNGWVSAVAIVMSGLGCSGIFPCMLALTGNLFHAVTGSALGILASMIWVGAMTIVWAFGIISENLTMGSGFSAMVFSSLAAFSVFLFKYRRLVEEERKHLPSL